MAARQVTRNLKDVIERQVLLRNVKSITVNYSKVGPGQAGARFVRALTWFVVSWSGVARAASSAYRSEPAWCLSVVVRQLVVRAVSRRRGHCRRG